jgi:uncharacterized protein YidB (DUF937 family)
LTQSLGTDPNAALTGLAGAVREEGGLDAMVSKLNDAGLGDAVGSWVGTGPNQQVDPQALGSALGDDEVQRLAGKSGLDIGAMLPLLAAALPAIINVLTPKGQVPEGGLNNAVQQQGDDIGSLLGGLLGGGGSGGSGGMGDVLGGLLGGNKGS